MSILFRTDNGKRYKTPSTGAQVGGVLAGSTALMTMSLGSTPIAIPFIKGLKYQNKNVDTVEITKTLETAIQKTGLEQSGVTLYKLSEKNALKTSNKFKQFIADWTNPITASAKGNNAAFDHYTNSILINPEKMGLAGFHEIGHAINFNQSKFWKIMQKSRMPIMGLTGLIGFTSILKRKKEVGERPNGAFDKITTFVKNNAGKLTLLVSTPILAEEIKASLRGNKLAKELLSPTMYKKVLKGNGFGALSYLSSFLITALSVVTASKIRDKIASAKEIK